MSIKHWMSWEAGVDLVALTDTKIASPNIIVHVARVVHTPVGSAPAGMILWQPDTAAQPLLAGFISPDLNIARYFGPAIFAGTPFEHAPAIQAQIEITLGLPGSVSAKVQAAGFTFETRLSSLGALAAVNRQPGSFTPFAQQALEASAAAANLTLNGKHIPLVVPSTGITGGPGAVWSPTGIYSR
jgi:hypothetical protein